MARIVGFDEVTLESTRIHEGVSCGWRAFSAGGERILQLDTYGSETRKILGKVSQSIQLDQASAQELLRIILRTFPALERRLADE